MRKAFSGKQKRLWLGIAVSTISLLAIFIFINPSEILLALSNVQPELLALVLLSMLIFLIFRAVRWQFMLNGGWSHSVSTPYSKVFHIQNIGYMLTNILPFRLGDVARAVLIGNVPPNSISKGLSTMVVERVFDLLFFVILFPFTLASVSNLPAEVRAAILLGGLLAIITAILLILAANQRTIALGFSGWILDRLRFLDKSVWMRRLDDLLLGLGTLTNFRDGSTLLLLSILVWIPIIIGYYLALLAVNIQPTIAEAAFITCITAFSVTAPSSPGQVGVFEASATFAMVTILGMPLAESAGFAFLYHASNYLLLAILGIIGISRTGTTIGNVIAAARSVVPSRSS